MQSLNSSCPKDLIENLDLVDQLKCDFLKSHRQLCNISYGHSEILPKVRVLFGLEAIDHSADNVGTAVVIRIDDLIFAFQVDGATH